MTRFSGRTSAKVGESILSVTTKYLTIMAKRLTTSRIAFYSLLLGVHLDLGRPLRKLNKIYNYGSMGVGKDYSSSYGLCVWLLDHAHTVQVFIYCAMSLSIPGQ
jgi:hypothetical protein